MLSNYTWKNFSLEEQDKILAAPSNNELCDKKIKSAWPQILDIKESLIKYVFEPNKQRGGKVRGGLERRVLITVDYAELNDRRVVIFEIIVKYLFVLFR